MGSHNRERLISIKEAAYRIGRSESSIERMGNRGVLVKRMVNGRLFYTEDSVSIVSEAVRNGVYHHHTLYLIVKIERLERRIDILESSQETSRSSRSS